MTATRRLAAILAADVAGYSRLMEADEEGTLTVMRPRCLATLGSPDRTQRRVLAFGFGHLVLRGASAHIQAFDAIVNIATK